MSFYQQIAPYYHHIFKINVDQVNFIKLKISKKESNIVDVGCGIGTLSFELANYYDNIVGIDMDAEMINAASNKNISKNIEFQQISMLELNTIIDKNSTDGIVCFGNTLVHLNSLSEITNFLQQSRAVLKPNGKLLLQIVNYNKIIEKEIRELPLIENDELIFERNYKYHKSVNKIDFNTKLTVKSTQQLIENSIELLPLLKEEFATLLNNAGFRNCNYYGNFKMESFSIESPALIIEAW